jgi:hypothetical protein
MLISIIDVLLRDSAENQQNASLSDPTAVRPDRMIELTCRGSPSGTGAPARAAGGLRNTL